MNQQQLTELFRAVLPEKQQKTEKELPMSEKKVTGAGAEDGDFVALRARREERSENTEDLTDGETLLIQPVLRDALKSLTGRTRSVAISLFDEASKADTEQFEKLLNETQQPLDMRHPSTSQTILLHVLAVGRPDLARLLVARVDLKLLCQDCDVTVASLKGKKNVLHYVTELKDVDLAKQILEKIADLDAKKALLMQETPVQIEGQRPRTLPCCHLAAFLGCKELVVVYLANGVTVDATNSKKDTALLWAARWNHLDIVEELLSRRADANIENDKGSTALYWAVRYGHTDTVRVLISLGKADVTKTRKLGLVSPIILGSALGYLSIVKLLIDGGANPNECIRGKERPIHHAAREGYADIVEYLLKKGALIDEKDEAGDTALLNAARYGHAHCLQLLLAKGANHTVKNHKGDDLMALAVGSDDRRIMKMVLQFVKTHGEVKGSRSPLLLAAGGGHMDKVRTLLGLGLDPATVDDEGNTMMHYAAMENQPDIIEAFHGQVKVDTKNNAGNTALHEACARGHAESILALINSKATASIPNDKGKTALHVAAFCRTIQPDTVRKLMDYVIKSHAWESLSIKDNEGSNALHIAAKFARSEVMWEFRHVPFKIKDAEGNIALHEAVRPGEPDALDTMLDIYETMKRDADINEQNNQGQTVLHLAAREGFREHVARLVLLGADLSLQDNEGNTVFHTLVQLSADCPQKAQMYVAVFQALLDQATVWWVMKHQMHYPHGDDRALKAHTLKASLTLLTSTYNHTDRNVIAMACQVGASDILRYLLSKKDVMCYHQDNDVIYNVTNMTPLTNNSLTGCCSQNSVVHRPSYIEFLMSLQNPEAACKVLDLQPFCEIEKAYSSVAAWTYAIIIIIHIFYMSLFSYSGVTLLGKRRENPGDDSLDAATIMLYVIAPMEPAIILFYKVYSFVKVRWTGDLPRTARMNEMLKLNVASSFLYRVLPTLISVVYSAFVIVWIVLYGVDNSKMDYVFSVAVCMGWLYTISFTRGFRIIHYFWRMIQNMIVKDILKFLFIYLFVLLAFAFAFHAMFQVSQSIADTYSSPFDTAFLLFNVMVGMGEFFDESLENSMSAAGRDTVYEKVLYVAYIVLGTILLLNLLIAMMNDSYAAILNRHSVSWRMESVQLGVDIEKAFPITTKLFSSVKFKRVRSSSLADDEHASLAAIADQSKEFWYISVAGPRLQEELELGDKTERGVMRDLKLKVDSLEQRLVSDLQQVKHDLDDIRALVRNRDQETTHF